MEFTEIVAMSVAIVIIILLVGIFIGLVQGAAQNVVQTEDSPYAGNCGTGYAEKYVNYNFAEMAGSALLQNSIVALVD